jgi:hypothetical protein
MSDTVALSTVVHFDAVDDDRDSQPRLPTDSSPPPHAASQAACGIVAPSSAARPAAATDESDQQTPFSADGTPSAATPNTVAAFVESGIYTA